MARGKKKKKGPGGQNPESGLVFCVVMIKSASFKFLYFNSVNCEINFLIAKAYVLTSRGLRP